MQKERKSEEKGTNLRMEKVRKAKDALKIGRYDDPAFLERIFEEMAGRILRDLSKIVP